jgi:hypothetical protein
VAELNGGSIVFGSASGRIALLYSPGSVGEATLRTRCPGPESSQVGLAGGFTSPSGLRASPVTLALRSVGPFVDDGYAGSVTSTLRITLARGRVQTGVTTQSIG